MVVAKIEARHPYLLEERTSVMAVTHVYPRRPTAPTRRVARTKTTRLHRVTHHDSGHTARPRRRADAASRLRTILATLRALLEKAGRKLTSSFSMRAVASFAGIISLVIDCFALHAVLIA